MQDAPEVQEPSQTTEMSLFSKLANMFAAPGEVFGEIKSSPPNTAHWLVPTLLLLLMGSVFTVAMFSNANVRSQLEVQAEERVDKMVEKGTIPAEARERVLDQQTSMLGSPLAIVFGIVGVSVVTFATLFGLTLVWWLSGKWLFKAPVKYGKILEVVGLSSAISVLGMVVTLLLLLSFESIYATPSLALAVLENFDPENIVHSLFASVNVFTLWYLGVTAVGLGKVCDVAIGKASVPVFTLWAIFSVAVAVIDIPFF